MRTRKVAHNSQGDSIRARKVIEVVGGTEKSERLLLGREFKVRNTNTWRKRNSEYKPKLSVPHTTLRLSQPISGHRGFQSSSICSVSAHGKVNLPKAHLPCLLTCCLRLDPARLGARLAHGALSLKAESSAAPTYQDDGRPPTPCRPHKAPPFASSAAPRRARLQTSSPRQTRSAKCSPRSNAQSSTEAVRKAAWAPSRLLL